LTPHEAIARLENRDRFLAVKIEGLIAENRPTFWLEQDREAIALAVSALDYLHQVQEYEASQNPRA
jgi:hypothetical protein